MKLPQISGNELIRKLQHAGFIAIRQSGSHVRMEKRTAEEVIKLTIPLHNKLKKGTLHHILKEAQIRPEELENL